jgi:hypothetical protein
VGACTGFSSSKVISWGMLGIGELLLAGPKALSSKPWSSACICRSQNRCHFKVPSASECRDYCNDSPAAMQTTLLDSAELPKDVHHHRHRRGAWATCTGVPGSNMLSRGGWGVRRRHTCADLEADAGAGWLAQKLPAPAEGAASHAGAALGGAAATGACWEQLLGRWDACPSVAGSTSASTGGHSPSANAPLYCAQSTVA